MIIRFSKNWNNKLDCDVFTTIRKGKRKWSKYVNKVFDIWLQGEPDCRAILKEVYTSKFCDIPFVLLFFDTGMTDKGEVCKVFQGFGVRFEDEVNILLFEKVAQ